MKTKIILLALSLFFISIGCKKLNPKKELRIDLGTSFNNDLVAIRLDDTIIFSDTVSTNNSLSVAKILTDSYPIGQYQISVTVNGVEKTSKFRHKKDCYIYVSYDKSTSIINITYPKEKTLYD